MSIFFNAVSLLDMSGSKESVGSQDYWRRIPFFICELPLIFGNVCCILHDEEFGVSSLKLVTIKG